eukprot:CAMPEP_0176003382 /NCGR_PEP_ID=MMETSP0120_2-20121206/1144_1 /TAXON_ID=160619 /ORGANISM="Kryptoperidinium foliaceum, Strain CCMP 1326" /LENGTH=74 /DNA_ID=CAMNT_0017336021 /DNA_START=57 /DNA_END=281 /DNA_ORIENTATION=-
MGGKYDDYDWKELPDNIKAAAEKLGYNKKLWDKDREPKECDVYWKELTPEQQEAAKLLGYNQEEWDAESSSDEE